MVTGQVEDQKRKRRHRTMRRTGRLEVRTILPGDVDADRVEAHLVDGVPTITVPKAQAAKPWHIEVIAYGRRGGAVSVDAAWPITTNRETDRELQQLRGMTR